MALTAINIDIDIKLINISPFEIYFSCCIMEGMEEYRFWFWYGVLVTNNRRQVGTEIIMRTGF